jgi:hypothetical protein
MTDNNQFNVESLRLPQDQLGPKPGLTRPSGIRHGGEIYAPGVWVPQDLALALGRLRLQPASRMSVLTTIVFVWCRYGCNEAWLEISEIAELTNQSKRTVNGALRVLIELGFIKRVGRCRTFVVNPEALINFSQASPGHQRGRGRREGGHSTSEDSLRRSPASPQTSKKRVAARIIPRDQASIERTPVVDDDHLDERATEATNREASPCK